MKKATRTNTKTNETITYLCTYAGEKLVGVVNESTGKFIPPETRTFKKIKNRHPQFTITES